MIIFSFIHTGIFLAIHIKFEPFIWQKLDHLQRLTMFVQLIICVAAFILYFANDPIVYIMLEVIAFIAVFYWFVRWIKLVVFAECYFNDLEEKKEAKVILADGKDTIKAKLQRMQGKPMLLLKNMI